MKNDSLLKSLSQKGLKAICNSKENTLSLPTKKVICYLDSGQLISIKGGNIGDDDILFGN